MTKKIIITLNHQDFHVAVTQYLKEKHGIVAENSLLRTYGPRGEGVGVFEAEVEFLNVKD